jgi:hypothetical protein
VNEYMSVPQILKVMIQTNAGIRLSCFKVTLQVTFENRRWTVFVETAVHCTFSRPHEARVLGKMPFLMLYRHDGGNGAPCFL